jgi:hypothetical protein
MRILPMIAACSAALLLAACGAPAPSEDEDLRGNGPTTITPDYRARIAQVSRLMAEICSRASTQAYYAKTPCLPSGMTRAQVRDTSRATWAQKKAAREAFAEMKRLNEETRRMMTASGLEEYRAIVQHSREKVDPRVERMQNGLLNGTITWGEYNRERLRLLEESTGRRAPLSL